MKPSHLEVLQHALGATQYGTMPRRGSERNYYGTDGDDPDCNELVALGYMDKGSPKTWTPDIFFAVTEEGKKAMREASPALPKVTRSQKRYQDFLDASDAWGCSFREYLDIIRTDWYKEMKG